MVYTLETVVAEMLLLKSRVAALESGGVASAAQDDGQVRQEQPIADHQLDNAWADKKITKELKGWKGATHVGKTWARASIEWLELAASRQEYAAHMGRMQPDDDPKKWMDKLDKNGKRKAWHESNSFDAKILRGWAVRKKAKAAAAPSPADDEFNHGANAEADDSGIGF